MIGSSPLKTIIKMKNIAKLSAAVLIVSSLAACDPPKKSPAGPDSGSTTVKVDTSAKTIIDSNKTDTGEKDPVKK